MTSLTLALPGIGEAPSPYTHSPRVFIGDLFRYPDAVAEGMRRELERFEHGSIPAFADNRRIWTPHGSFFIRQDGQPSHWLTSAVDFDDRAHHYAPRMAIDTAYSFNRTFAQRYLKENNYA